MGLIILELEDGVDAGELEELLENELGLKTMKHDPKHVVWKYQELEILSLFPEMKVRTKKGLKIKVHGNIDYFKDFDDDHLFGNGVTVVERNGRWEAWIVVDDSSINIDNIDLDALLQKIKDSGLYDDFRASIAAIERGEIT